MSKNPDYVSSRHSYGKRIATACRICGGKMYDPEECKNEYHKECMKTYKKKSYGVQ